jgi:hypothetical protein
VKIVFPLSIFFLLKYERTQNRKENYEKADLCFHFSPVFKQPLVFTSIFKTIKMITRGMKTSKFTVIDTLLSLVAEKLQN